MGDAVAGGRPEGAISLHGFMEVDHAGALAAYVATLETFVRLEQLQELKGLARERTGTGPSRSVLDVGCGFRIEPLRLARLVQPGGSDAEALVAASAASSASASATWRSRWTRSRCRATA